MTRCLRVLSLFVLAMVLAAPAAVSACPMCKDAISASGNDPTSEEAETGMNNARAYNSNILAMIGVMYGSLFMVSFFIYRGVKKNAAYLQQIRTQTQG